MPRSSAIAWFDCAAHEHEEHLQLALGQAGRQLARSLRARGARRRRAPRRRRPGRAVPRSASRRSSASAAGGVERRPVRPRLAHRAVAVGGGEDAGRLVERRPAGAAVVAGAVEPLVVGAGQEPDRGERRRLGERALGEVRVQPHALPFAEPERARLLPDRVRHADAAEVVRERGASHERDGVRRQAHAPGGGLGELGHARRVLAQPRRLEAGDRGDGRERGVDPLARDPDSAETARSRAPAPTSAPRRARRGARRSSARRARRAAGS